MSVQSYFRPISGLSDPKVNMFANPSNHPANMAVEKANVDKGHKKCSQYFIFMVALDAASSSVLFHAALSFEFLK